MRIQWDTTNTIRRSSYRSGLNSASIWPANIGALTNLGVDNWRMVMFPVEDWEIIEDWDSTKRQTQSWICLRGPLSKKQTNIFEIPHFWWIFHRQNQLTFNKPRSFVKSVSSHGDVVGFEWISTMDHVMFPPKISSEFGHCSYDVKKNFRLHLNKRGFLWENPCFIVLLLCFSTLQFRSSHPLVVPLRFSSVYPLVN